MNLSRLNKIVNLLSSERSCISQADDQNFGVIFNPQTQEEEIISNREIKELLEKKIIKKTMNFATKPLWDRKRFNNQIFTLNKSDDKTFKTFKEYYNYNSTF